MREVIASGDTLDGAVLVKVEKTLIAKRHFTVYAANTYLTSFEIDFIYLRFAARLRLQRTPKNRSVAARATFSRSRLGFRIGDQFQYYAFLRLNFSVVLV